jgi:tetratricopeptide (TPR) repeat protein
MIEIDIMGINISIQIKRTKVSIIERIFRRAEEKYASGSFPDAVIDCLEILESKPKHEAAIELLARCYYKLKDYQSSYLCYKRLIDLGSRLEMTKWFNYEWCCYKLGLHSDFIDSLPSVFHSKMVE